jgi:hypothetical protein
MVKLINKILGRIKNKKINNLTIGRSVKFTNNGTLKLGYSNLGAIDNLTVLVTNKRNKSYFLTRVIFLLEMDREFTKDLEYTFQNKEVL